MSDSELPDPLVPAEVDLRDFGFMPLDIRRLLTSETWIEAAEDPRLGHALMSLWCESWHQVPAGSLPDNDKVLQRLSMCPDQKEWRRIRDRALEGWRKCSDGLLYHPVVCEKAFESWEKKLAQRERTRKATEERERRRRERDEEERRRRDEQRNEQRNVERDVNRDVHQGTGTVKGQGEGQGDLEKQRRAHMHAHVATGEPDSPSGAPPQDLKPPNTEPHPTRRGAIAVLLRNQGVTCTYSHPTVVEWAQNGVTDEQLTEAVAVARMRKREGEPVPIAYLVPILAEILNPKPLTPASPITPGWWADEASTIREATRLGIRANPGEEMPQFRARIRQAHEREKQGSHAA